MRKWLILFTVILVIILASVPLVSCQGQTTSTSSETAPTETQPTGQTLDTGQPEEPPTKPEPPAEPEPPTEPEPPAEPGPPIGPSEITAEAQRIEPNPAEGFNYAYYLYIPSAIQNTDNGNQKTYLLVEGNNSGGVTSDDQAVHDEAARKIAQKKAAPLAEALRVPLLVPAFPLPAEYNPGGAVIMNTQGLDRDTLLTDIDDLERLDLQLIAMIDDAIERLSQEGINVENKILMNGFSASGAFASRFVILHPERIQTATIGPCMGWPMVPVSEWNGITLIYPLGIADIKEIVGEEFDIEVLKSVPLYFYLGNEDMDQGEGKEMQLMFQFGDTPAARFPVAERIYNSVGCSSQFVLYSGVEHEVTSEELEDIITFFSNHLESR